MAELPTLAEFDATLAGLVIETTAGAWSLGPVREGDLAAGVVVEFLAQLIEANPALVAFIASRLDAGGRVRVTELVDALENTAMHGAVPCG